MRWLGSSERRVAALAQQVVPVDPDSAASAPYAGPVPEKFVSFGGMLSQPLSRGSVHIQSRNPTTPPAIDPRYLSHPVDVEVFARHMRHLDATVASSPAFTDTAHGILKEPRRRRDPAASHLADLDAARRYVRTSAISMWHPGGTCAVPLISTANLQATVYAFAERAADLIKEDYGLV
ncbi:hypothetical protein SLS62_003673 [Diatrype stigma]|uniref:Glucose-methanol-choline oxidoreductase C-terminal domain-containing protein n=1 Tax=Diatrype stigma TaxID=117547 RepID=A0AAN9USI5_9PEZI